MFSQGLSDILLLIGICMFMSILAKNLLGLDIKIYETNNNVLRRDNLK